jgi:hypothetical protein
VLRIFTGDIDRGAFRHWLAEIIVDYAALPLEEKRCG